MSENPKGLEMFRPVSLPSRKVDEVSVPPVRRGTESTIVIPQRKVRRCRLCPSRNKPIGGDGPQPSRVLLIGEGPGKQEDRRRDENGDGKPFVGDSGVELDGLYLQLAGLRRSRVRISNLVHCIPDPEGGNPGPHLAKCCMDEWMLQELNETQPEVIVTLGSIAYHTMFPEAPSLEHQHGRPFIGTYRSWMGMVVPMYHPKAGMRRSDLMGDLIEDFKGLRRILAGEDVEPHDEYPDVRYEEIRTRRELWEWVEPGEETGVIAIDTETEPVEGDEHYPYCLSLSTTPGTGGVVRMGNDEVLRLLGKWVKESKVRVAMHNQPFDVQILDKMGIETPKFHDTLAMVYHLQTLPQGLKVLALRLLGVRMTDFDDVVRPYAIREVVEYMRRAVDVMGLPEAVLGGVDRGGVRAIENPFHDLVKVVEKTTKRGGTKYTTKPESVNVRKRLYREWLGMELAPDQIESYRRHDGGIVPVEGEEEYVKTFLSVLNEYRTGSERMVSGIRRLITSLEAGLPVNYGEDQADEDEDDEEGEGGDRGNPWRLWKEWRKRDRERGVDMVGRIITAAGGRQIPPLSIRYTPWDEVVQYAARDADVTLRLYPVIRRLRANMWARITGNRV